MSFLEANTAEAAELEAPIHEHDEHGRPLFAPTPLIQSGTDIFLKRYLDHLEYAKPTMLPYVYQAVKNTVEETSVKRGVANRSSFAKRRVKDLSHTKPELLEGLRQGTNEFDESLTLRDDLEMDSIECLRYTPQVQDRDSKYPTLRRVARAGILRYDLNAHLKSAEIDRTELVSIYPTEKQTALNGFVLFNRLNHGFANESETIRVREKLHNVIRLDDKSPIHELPSSIHEPLIVELDSAFKKAKRTSNETWERHMTADTIPDDIALSSDTERLASTVEFARREQAAKAARLDFFTMYLHNTPILSDLVSQALMDEYTPMPRWIVPIDTQMYVGVIKPSA